MSDPSAAAARLRLDGEEGTADLVRLEEDLRQGRLLAHEGELLHPPWTGPFFLRLDEIPALREALSTPAARLAARLHQRSWPWATLLLCGVVLSAALAQAVADPVTAGRWLVWGRVGWDAALLNGQWWGVWTAHLLHSEAMPLLHALANLAFILYCGMRVEQAWGVGGLLRVVAASAAGGALAVVALGAMPVVGSSMVAFGLIGAQIAIGVRMGDALPPQRQAAYGWGNLLALVLIFVLNKLIVVVLTGWVGPGQGVSHLGHLGGLLGGIAAVLLGTPAILRPRRGHLRDGLATAGTLLLPAGVVLALPLSPTGAGMPWQAVDVPEVNLSVRLPRHLAQHPTQFAGLAGWRGDADGAEPFLLDRMVYRSYAVRDSFSWTLWWSAQLDEALEPVAAPDPPPGWTALAWAGELSHIVELQRTEGLDVVRIAWRLDRDGPPDHGARARLYRQIAETVEVRPPPALATQSATYTRFHDAPDEALRYAEALWRAGQWSEAEAILAPLVASGGRWSTDAARLRLQVLVTAPDASVLTPPAVGWEAPFLDAAPITDMAMHRLGIRWLATQGACAAAAARLATAQTEAQRWLRRHPAAEAAESAAVVARGLDEASAAVADCAQRGDSSASRSGPSTSP